jgi:hypothetical protein|nr:MAG TPA: hypothetical protein [Caudoviricetes sp.]
MLEYITGVVVAFVVLLLYLIFVEREIRLKDVFYVIFLSLFSWVVFATFFIVILLYVATSTDNVVLWKKKDK